MKLKEKPRIINQYEQTLWFVSSAFKPIPKVVKELRNAEGMKM